MSDQIIDPQPWMTSPETSAVLDALTGGGAGVRFVGGCVRDAILGRPVADIDIATEAPPARVMELLRAADIKAIPTGIEHGTITAVSGGQPYEITTLRHDVETHGRHATVAFTDDWDADASRRDFTMNALSLEPGGTLHDPFGGIADLRAGRVRFVGDARQRIGEDVLRLLRFFRFYAHYGQPPPDADSLAACREMADRLPNLSAERVRTELLKLLAASDPESVVRLMNDEGVLAHFLPQATAIDRLARLVAIESGLGLCDPLRRLAALAPMDAAGARDLAGRLRLSNAQRGRLVAMVSPTLSPALDEAARRRALYATGAGAWPDAVLSAWAECGADPKDTDWRELFKAAEGWTRPVFPLTGADVKSLGIGEGAVVGKLLRAVEAWWIEGDFRADKDACLKQLQAIAER